MSLLEVLIAISILSGAMLSVFLFLAKAIISTENSNDLITATSHAEYLLEEMHTRTSLANITSDNWSNWAQSAGLNTLPSETIAVNFPDTGSDPLEVQTTVSWTKNSKANAVVLTTEITK